MRITVTARHCHISDELKARAEQIVERVAKIASRPQRAEIIFDVDHGVKVVELKLTLPRGIIRVSSAEADDFRTAVDRAAAKLRNQLDKDTEHPVHHSSTQ
ncbi:MAG: HPF/RaiA family ribosome-associated protein [Gemmatimonadales bacterium]